MTITLIAFISFCVILLIYMFLVARENNIVELNVYDPKLPESFDGFSLFFISDIHRRVIDDELIHKVKNHANIVIIGGDLTERGVPIHRTAENLKKLNQIGPTYFIWGNNDVEVGPSQLKNLLLSYHVKILENEHECLISNSNEKLYLVGIGEISFGNDHLIEAIEEIEKEFKIVICHNPEIVHKVEENHHISLILSGHTHGGQIRILGFGPYSKGRFYSLQYTKLLISNGYGTTQIPLRLGAKPETHLITFKRK